MNIVKTVTALIVSAGLNTLSFCQAEEVNFPDLKASSAQDLIISKGCSSCHSLEDVPAAKGTVGPPLDDLSERIYIGGVLPNSPKKLTEFLMKPHYFHADTAMPQPRLTRQEAEYLSHFLWNL